MEISISISQISNSSKCVLFGRCDAEVFGIIRSLGADISMNGKKAKYLYVLLACDAYTEKTSQQNDAS